MSETPNKETSTAGEEAHQAATEELSASGSDKMAAPRDGLTPGVESPADTPGPGAPPAAIEKEEAKDGLAQASRLEPEEASGMPAEKSPPFKSKWDDIFNGCAKIGPLYILVFLCLMVWPDYWHGASGSFCPPEIRSVTAYLHCIQDSSWLAPVALDQGSWSAPQWPLFYLFIGLLAFIPGLAEAGWLIPLSTASSAAVALLGAGFFTHAAGFGARAAFAAMLILLCAPIFAPLHHFFGPVSLATGLLLFSLAFFCRGWRARRAWISLPLAFVFAALAGLCGGVLYIAVPLLGSFFYLIWQGNYRRGQRLDAITGFLLMLIIIGSWMAAVTLGAYPGDYLGNLFADSISFSWPPQHYWFLALIAGALGLLPWILCIFGVSWFRVLRDSLKTFSASRHDNASALMWLALVLACCLALFVPHTPLAAITIAGLLAPLLGKAFVKLSSTGNRFFFFLASLFTILAGAFFLALHFEASRQMIFDMLPLKPPAIAGEELQNLDAVMILGAICILAGLFGFFFVRRNRGGGGLIYASIITVIIGQLALFMIAPKLQENPRLPLKQLDAIAQEVEAAQHVAPAPSTQPLPTVPEEQPGQLESQPAPVLPEQSVTPPDSGSQLQAVPEAGQGMSGEAPADQSGTAPLPPGDVNVPQQSPEPPAQDLPGAQGEAATTPSVENPEAGIPMTLPDAIEVPQAGQQEIIVIEENPASPVQDAPESKSGETPAAN